MNWLTILFVAILSIGLAELMVGDIANKIAVVGVAILLFTFVWICYGFLKVNGG